MKNLLLPILFFALLLLPACQSVSVEEFNALNERVNTLSTSVAELENSSPSTEKRFRLLTSRANKALQLIIPPIPILIKH